MNKSSPYDVIVVGAGPSGIFTILELLKINPGLRILLLEKGKDIKERHCPMMLRDISCKACPVCELLSGWGGAGAFSDGKLNLSKEVGGYLSEYIPAGELSGLIDYVDSIYRQFGAPEYLYGEKTEDIERLKNLCSKNDLILVRSRIRHIGTERCREVLTGIREFVDEKIDILFEEKVTRLIVEGGSVKGIRTAGGDEYHSAFVVVSPGREGAEWLEREARRLKLTLLNNPVDIGVRVEVPASVLEPLTSITYEPKLIYYSKAFDDRVRTFCVNPYGEVVKEYLKGLWTVNGHSYSGTRTDNTNFALLVSTYFTEPFHEPLSYGRYIARLANFLGQGVLVQRLGDLKRGRRSTPERIEKGLVRPTLRDATPGDLSFVLPYRFLTDIVEMLDAMERVAPGVASRHTLLYGVEVKFYSRKLKLTGELETEIENLFATGDGAGVSRGLIQASVSGVIAARAIGKRIKVS
ncbi:MAG TPA: FAD-dependent oxidoreductase [Nitrospirae bacterium]|nr:FAD-dependent oxidoreductase [Nitrospirota bacterium]